MKLGKRWKSAPKMRVSIGYSYINGVGHLVQYISWNVGAPPPGMERGRDARKPERVQPAN